MKFTKLEKINFKKIEIEIFEVRDKYEKIKPYLMIRMKNGGNHIGDIYSSPEKWAYKAEMKIKKIGGGR